MKICPDIHPQAVADLSNKLREYLLKDIENAAPDDPRSVDDVMYAVMSFAATVCSGGLMKAHEVGFDQVTKHYAAMYLFSSMLRDNVRRLCDNRGIPMIDLATVSILPPVESSPPTEKKQKDDQASLLESMLFDISKGTVH